MLLRCLAGLILVSFPMLGSGQSIETKVAPGVDLTTYQTFTVIKGEFMTPPDQQRIDENALFEGVERAVKQEMELRGYTYVGDSSAQLYVSYVAGSFDFTEGGSIGPLGQTPASTPSDMNQSRTWSRETKQGMMVIDVTDGRQKELWSASGTLTLDGVELDRTIEAVVYRAFKKFPNKNKKKKKKKQE